MEPVGRTLGHYHIVAELGRGGMGVVYRAEDVRLGRQVALKALPPEVASQEDRIARFRQEARSLAALNHPCIVTLYAVEEIDGQLLLAMELVEGKTLGQTIPPGGFELERFFRLALPLVDALSAAHECGIVHRDLKPGNVLVTPRGRVKVLDFGLAKLRAAGDDGTVSRASTLALTSEGAVPGTLPYMSPEQIRGSPADERSDLFALGILLYQMATGRHPFKGASGYSADVVSSILRDEPPSLLRLRPDFPPELERILRSALEKDPERRFQSAKELRNQLEKLKEELTRPESPEPTPPAWRLRWRPVVALAAVATLLAALGFGLWNLGKPSEPPPPLAKLPHLAVAESRFFSGERGPEYFRRGLVAALAERLAGLQGVWVVPPGSSPVPDRLVEVDVRKMAEVVTLQLRIQDPQSHRIVGSEVLEGSALAPYDLLDRAGESVVSLLRAEPGMSVRYEAGPAPTQEPAAFDLFLQARDRSAGGGGPPDSGAALVLVQRALRADRRFAPAQVLEGELRRQRYEETGDPKSLDAADQGCRRAVEVDPNLATAHLCLARIHQARKRLLEAQQEYLQAIELQPTSLDAYNELGKVFREMGVPVTAAERVWEQVIDRHPNYWAGYWALGGFYTDSEKYAAASDQYRKALELAPNNAEVLLTLGAADYFLGRHEEAIIAWQRSAQIDAGYGALINLGTVYLLLGHFREAVNSLERAVQVPGADYRAYSRLADAYVRAPGHQKLAAAAFERAAALCRGALARDPESASAWIYLAQNLAMLGRREEALAALGTALELRPSDPHYSYLAAIVHNRLGEREQALESLERAVEGGWGSAEIRFSVEFDNLRDEPRFQKLLAGE